MLWCKSKTVRYYGSAVGAAKKNNQFGESCFRERALKTPLGFTDQCGSLRLRRLSAAFWPLKIIFGTTFLQISGGNNNNFQSKVVKYISLKSTGATIFY
jgi:hypothetical protein